MLTFILTLAIAGVFIYTYRCITKLSEQISELVENIEQMHNTEKAMSAEINKIKYQNKKRYYSRPKKEIIQG